MPQSRRKPRPRRISREGEIFVSHNHVAILNGLLDRPDGTVSSSADLCRAARPYLKLFGSTLSDWNITCRAWKMRRTWLETRKVGERRIWQITPEGRRVVSGDVPLRIKGYGVYHGMREVRERLAAGSRATRIEAKWKAAFPEPGFQPLAQDVIELFRIWNVRNAPKGIGMGPSMKHHWLKTRVWAFLCQYALRYRAVPQGVYNLSPKNRMKELVIDFSSLRRAR